MGIDSNQSEIREFLDKVKDKDPAELMSLGASQLTSFASPGRSDAPTSVSNSNNCVVHEKEPARAAPDTAGSSEDFDGINLFD